MPTADSGKPSPSKLALLAKIDRMKADLADYERRVHRLPDDFDAEQQKTLWCLMLAFYAL